MLVRVACDAACERIHKEMKMQKAKFCFYFPKRKGWVRRNAPALRGRGCEFLLVVTAISCKSGGFRPIVKASACFAVIAGSRSGWSGLIYPVCIRFKAPVVVGEGMLSSSLSSPEIRGSEKQQLIMPDRLKRGER